MRAGAELYGPVPYQWYWLPAGIGILIVIGVWYGYVFWATRAARPRISRSDLAATRARYHQRITDVGRQSQLGSMSVRIAHQRLSELVRGYVAETGSVAAGSMTLRDLRAAGPEKPEMRLVTDVIGAFYPPEFEVESRGDPDAAVAIAHQVVERLP